MEEDFIFWFFLKKNWINSFSKEWALQIPHKTLDYKLPPSQIISRFDFFWFIHFAIYLNIILYLDV